MKSHKGDSKIFIVLGLAVVAVLLLSSRNKIGNGTINSCPYGQTCQQILTTEEKNKAVLQDYVTIHVYKSTDSPYNLDVSWNDCVDKASYLYSCFISDIMIDYYQQTNTYSIDVVCSCWKTT